MYSEKHVWPDNKKCAVVITLNLNAELFWLQLDPSCINMPKTLSLGQYGMSRGLERILDILDEKNIKSTCFVPGWVAENYTEKVREVNARGHELAVLGYHHENMALLSPEEQEKVFEKSIAALKNCCDATPKGFRSPEGELTLDTLRIAQKHGIEYSSNLCDDDRPYFKELGNEQCLLEIPIHWVNYDLPYFAFNYRPAFPAGQGRIANYSGVLSNWKDEFSGCYEYGLCYVLQLDPSAIGAPGRAYMLEELLTFMQSHDDVWFATAEEILKYENERIDRI